MDSYSLAAFSGRMPDLTVSSTAAAASLAFCRAAALSSSVGWTVLPSASLVEAAAPLKVIIS